MTDAHDITEGLDLLGDWLDAKGFTQEAGLCIRAMDEINRLREALKPLSEIADNHSAKRDDYPLYVRLLVGDLRAARAAMGESDE